MLSPESDAHEHTDFWHNDYRCQRVPFAVSMGTEIEVLVVGNCFLRKDAQEPGLKLDYKGAFELD